VPIRGEIISNHDMLEFEILDADPRRLKRVRVHKRVVVIDGEAVIKKTKSVEKTATAEEPATNVSDGPSPDRS
jgi:hypothetical protein